MTNDFPYDKDEWEFDDDEHEDRLDDLADRLYDEMICGDRTESSARSAYNRAKRGR